MQSILPRIGARIVSALPRNAISRSMGRAADARPVRPALDAAIRAYVRAFNVDLSEADMPPMGFESFDAFFTRRLKAGARPIDQSPNTLVSPADGKVFAVGSIDVGGNLRIKDQIYNFAELLGFDGDLPVNKAQLSLSAFHGGSYCVIYLSPRDYHRVHAPCEAPVPVVSYAPGTLFPVNAIAHHIPQVFARNERVTVVHAPPTGPIGTTLVGAFGVGRMTLSFDPIVSNTLMQAPVTRAYELPPTIGRGEELGMFHLGSTVVMSLGASTELEFLCAPGDTVQMGRVIAARPT